MGIFYATREQVMRTPEIMESAYAGLTVDARIDSASRAAEGLLHRRFYPEQRTILCDWPTANNYAPWEIDLWDQEMISLSAVSSGGTVITSDAILRRGDDLAEPPYSKLAIDLTSNSSFSAGDSWQRSLSISGLFGYSDTDTTFSSATLSGAINSSVTTIVLTPVSGYLNIGIGALIKIDSERMIIVDRRMSTTAQTTTSALLDTQASRSFTCAGASNFAIGETILIDAERMVINDIAGTTIIVTRAWDGSVLQSHSSGATIYALRTCIVQRGVLGSSAASHSDLASAYTHTYPALLTELVIAETINTLEQLSSGYARTIGTGAGTKLLPSAGLDDIRERAVRQLGRNQRSRAI